MRTPRRILAKEKIKSITAAGPAFCFAEGDSDDYNSESGDVKFEVQNVNFDIVGLKDIKNEYHNVILNQLKKLTGHKDLTLTHKQAKLKAKTAAQKENKSFNSSDFTCDYLNSD